MFRHFFTIINIMAPILHAMPVNFNSCKDAGDSNLCTTYITQSRNVTSDFVDRKRNEIKQLKDNGKLDYMLKNLIYYTNIYSVAISCYAEHKVPARDTSIEPCTSCLNCSVGLEVCTVFCTDLDPETTATTISTLDFTSNLSLASSLKKSLSGPIQIFSNIIDKEKSNDLWTAISLSLLAIMVFIIMFQLGKKCEIYFNKYNCISTLFLSLKNYRFYLCCFLLLILHK